MAISESVRMRKHAPLLGAIAVFVTFAGLQTAESGAGDNLQHFKILCRLQKIAKAKIPKFEPPTVDPGKIYNDATARIVIFSGKSDERPGSSQNTGGNSGHNESNSGIPIHDILKQAEDTEGKSGLTASAELRSLVLLRKKIETVKADYEKTQKEISEEEKKIREDLAQAIYGDATSTDFKGTAKTPVNFSKEEAVADITVDAELAKKAIPASDVTHACNGDGTAGTHAPSLVNDFYCLCAGGGVAVTAGTCYHQMGGSAAPTWKKIKVGGSDKDDANTLNGWPEVAKICDKLSPDVELTPSAIETGLTAFFAKMGKYKSGQQDKQDYIFGGAVNTLAQGCKGSNADDACINYHPILSKNHQIPWVKKFKDAEAKLINRNNLIRRLQDDANRLNHLADTVQAIQLPLATSDRTDQPALRSKSPNAQTAQLGKENVATASDPAAALAHAPASITRFSLPWTLLI